MKDLVHTQCIQTNKTTNYRTVTTNQKTYNTQQSTAIHYTYQPLIIYFHAHDKTCPRTSKSLISNPADNTKIIFYDSLYPFANDPHMYIGNSPRTLVNTNTNFMELVVRQFLTSTMISLLQQHKFQFYKNIKIS